jgi:hypothetical protein
MAKRKTKAKRYAVQRHIEVQPLTNGSKQYLDVAKALSECNHRLYRQSRVYRCKINHFGDPTDAGSLDVYVLRDTWMLQKAYQMAKDAYDKNMSEERADISPSNIARWQDFRVALNPASSGYTEVLPVIRSNGTLNMTSLSNGEFANSVVYKEDGTAMDFGFYGASSRWSIVEQYDRTADVDSKPSNTVSGSDINPYGALDDDNQQAARNDLQERGNAPPYDPNSLDGDKLFRKVGTLGARGGAQKLSTGFFDAPLGLIIMVPTAMGDTDDLYELEVQSGDYKGVHGAEYIDVTKKFSHRRG